VVDDRNKSSEHEYPMKRDHICRNEEVPGSPIDPMAAKAADGAVAFTCRDAAALKNTKNVNKPPPEEAKIGPIRLSTDRSPAPIRRNLTVSHRTLDRTRT